MQPDHGAFPELLDSTGGGRLFPPGDNLALCDQLHDLLTNEPMRRELANSGRENVLAKHSSAAAAQATFQVYSQYL